MVKPCNLAAPPDWHQIASNTFKNQISATHPSILSPTDAAIHLHTRTVRMSIAECDIMRLKREE